MRMQVRIVLSTVVVSMFMCGMASADVTPWANEDAGNGYQYCTSTDRGAVAFQCAGEWCAEIRADCYLFAPGFTGTTYNTSYFSEEQGRLSCSPGYVVQGFDVSGWDDRGDDISLNCAQVTPPYIESSCEWTEWFSDEFTNTPPSVQDPPWTGYAGDYVYCPPNAYVHGMECDGGWCDNMRLQCCEYDIAPPMPSVGLYEQCGGNGGVCGEYFGDWPECYTETSPHDNQWATCPVGSYCNRYSLWHWQCDPL